MITFVIALFCCSVIVWCFEKKRNELINLEIKHHAFTSDAYETWFKCAESCDSLQTSLLREDEENERLNALVIKYRSDNEHLKRSIASMKGAHTKRDNKLNDIEFHLVDSGGTVYAYWKTGLYVSSDSVYDEIRTTFGIKPPKRNG